jgi:hypothetical protein
MSFLMSFLGSDFFMTFVYIIIGVFISILVGY